MERGEWDDDAEASGEFSVAPVPRHERTWRHPSEVGAEQWAASEPPLVIGRGLSVVTGTIGLALAVGLLWAMLPSAGGNPSVVQTSGVRLGRDSFSVIPTTTIRPATTSALAVPSSTASTTSAVPAPAPVPTVVLASNATHSATPAVQLASTAGPLAVTTANAVAGASSMSVTLASGEVVEVRVLMVDSSTNIAVLALPAMPGDLAIEIADEIADGDEVTVVGPAPTVLTARLAVADGAVTVSVDDSTSVPEGAVVLDADGRLVGLCTHGDGSVALVAAAALSAAATKAGEMALETPWIGIEFVTTADPAPGGLEVARIADGSPAQQAGVHVGDRVRAIDGTPVATVADVVGILSHHRPGDVLVLDILRPSDDPSAPPTSSSISSTSTVTTTTVPTTTSMPTTSTATATTTGGTAAGAASSVPSATTTSAPSSSTTSTTTSTIAPTTTVPATAPTQLSVSVTLAPRPHGL